MKKSIAVVLLLVGMASFAQERKGRPERAEMEQLTPEQQNQLQLKKLTLELDLNASQQKEMSKIITEQSAKREAKLAARKTKQEVRTKPTAEERFERKNNMLDEQIAMKEKVKKILTPEQLKKWDEMNEHKQDAMKKRMEHKKRNSDSLKDK